MGRSKAPRIGKGVVRSSPQHHSNLKHSNIKMAHCVDGCTVAKKVAFSVAPKGNVCRHGENDIRNGRKTKTQVDDPIHEFGRVIDGFLLNRKDLLTIKCKMYIAMLVLHSDDR